MTLFALNVNIREEVHLNLDGSVTGAVFASTALNIERESARTVAALLRLLGLREEGTNLVEDTSVGGRVRPRRTPDWCLVDVYYFVQLVQALD